MTSATSSRLSSGRDVRLTEWTSCGGCAAKWAGTALSRLVGELGVPGGPGGPGGEGPDELLVGLAPFDDAAVYRLSSELALVSTTDFFPPLVDDPDDFGAIAAANACSDVFAMGARVVLAVNIAAFPEDLPEEAAAEIIAAAAAVVREAGGVVAGGHTIRSEEPIFGLAVQGLVHPEAVLTKIGSRPGDAVLLSKPLGTGICLAGGSAESKAAAIAGMRALNRASSETLVGLRPAVHALTDVTGFGLLGHASEMAQGSGVGIVFSGSKLPFYEGALEAAAAGVRTGGDSRNRRYVSGLGDVRSEVAEEIEALCFDPQTSGGLLCAVKPEVSEELEAAGFFHVGTVVRDRKPVALEP
ncbi:MAG: selenide, water dikinase SelD [Acidimicrobiales bacterium]